MSRSALRDPKNNPRRTAAASALRKTPDTLSRPRVYSNTLFIPLLLFLSLPHSISFLFLLHPFSHLIGHFAPRYLAYYHSNCRCSARPAREYFFTFNSYLPNRKIVTKYPRTHVCIKRYLKFMRVGAIPSPKIQTIKQYFS